MTALLSILAFVLVNAVLGVLFIATTRQTPPPPEHDPWGPPE